MQRKPKRSSILKPPKQTVRAPFQDLDGAQGDEDDENTTQPTSRRVSFSRTSQIKEFDPDIGYIAQWNQNYKETLNVIEGGEHFPASSNDFEEYNNLQRLQIIKRKRRSSKFQLSLNTGNAEAVDNTYLDLEQVQVDNKEKVLTKQPRKSMNSLKSEAVGKSDMSAFLEELDVSTSYADKTYASNVTNNLFHSTFFDENGEEDQGMFKSKSVLDDSLHPVRENKKTTFFDSDNLNAHTFCEDNEINKSADMDMTFGVNGFKDSGKNFTEMQNKSLLDLSMEMTVGIGKPRWDHSIIVPKESRENQNETVHKNVHKKYDTVLKEKDMNLVAQTFSILEGNKQNPMNALVFDICTNNDIDMDMTASGGMIDIDESYSEKPNECQKDNLNESLGLSNALGNLNLERVKVLDVKGDNSASLVTQIKKTECYNIISGTLSDDLHFDESLQSSDGMDFTKPIGKLNIQNLSNLVNILHVPESNDKIISQADQPFITKTDLNQDAEPIIQQQQFIDKGKKRPADSDMDYPIAGAGVQVNQSIKGRNADMDAVPQARLSHPKIQKIEDSSQNTAPEMIVTHKDLNTKRQESKENISNISVSDKQDPVNNVGKRFVGTIVYNKDENAIDHRNNGGDIAVCRANEMQGGVSITDNMEFTVPLGKLLQKESKMPFQQENSSKLFWQNASIVDHSELKENLPFSLFNNKNQNLISSSRKNPVIVKESAEHSVQVQCKNIDNKVDEKHSQIIHQDRLKYQNKEETNNPFPNGNLSRKLDLIEERSDSKIEVSQEDVSVSANTEFKNTDNVSTLVGDKQNFDLENKSHGTSGMECTIAAGNIYLSQSDVSQVNQYCQKDESVPDTEGIEFNVPVGKFLQKKSADSMKQEILHCQDVSRASLEKSISTPLVNRNMCLVSNDEPVSQETDHYCQQIDETLADTGGMEITVPRGELLQKKPEHSVQQERLHNHVVSCAELEENLPVTSLVNSGKCSKAGDEVVSRETDQYCQQKDETVPDTGGMEFTVPLGKLLQNNPEHSVFHERLHYQDVSNSELGENLPVTSLVNKEKCLKPGDEAVSQEADQYCQQIDETVPDTGGMEFTVPLGKLLQKESKTPFQQENSSTLFWQNASIVDHSELKENLPFSLFNNKNQNLISSSRKNPVIVKESAEHSVQVQCKNIDNKVDEKHSQIIHQDRLKYQNKEETNNPFPNGNLSRKLDPIEERSDSKIEVSQEDVSISANTEFKNTDNVSTLVGDKQNFDLENKSHGTSGMECTIAAGNIYLSQSDVSQVNQYCQKDESVPDTEGIEFNVPVGKFLQKKSAESMKQEILHCQDVSRASLEKSISTPLVNRNMCLVSNDEPVETDHYCQQIDETLADTGGMEITVPRGELLQKKPEHSVQQERLHNHVVSCAELEENLPVTSLVNSGKCSKAGDEVVSRETDQYCQQKDETVPDTGGMEFTVPLGKLLQNNPEHSVFHERLHYQDVSNSELGENLPVTSLVNKEKCLKPGDEAVSQETDQYCQQIDETVPDTGGMEFTVPLGKLLHKKSGYSVQPQRLLYEDVSNAELEENLSVTPLVIGEKCLVGTNDAVSQETEQYYHQKDKMVPVAEGMELTVQLGKLLQKISKPFVLNENSSKLYREGEECSSIDHENIVEGSGSNHKYESQFQVSKGTPVKKLCEESEEVVVKVCGAKTEMSRQAVSVSDSAYLRECTYISMLQKDKEDLEKENKCPSFSNMTYAVVVDKVHCNQSDNNNDEIIIKANQHDQPKDETVHGTEEMECGDSLVNLSHTKSENFKTPGKIQGNQQENLLVGENNDLKDNHCNSLLPSKEPHLYDFNSKSTYGSSNQVSLKFTDCEDIENESQGIQEDKVTYPHTDRMDVTLPVEKLVKKMDNPVQQEFTNAELKVKDTVSTLGIDDENFMGKDSKLLAATDMEYTPANGKSFRNAEYCVDSANITTRSRFFHQKDETVCDDQGMEFTIPLGELKKHNLGEDIEQAFNTKRDIENKNQTKCIKVGKEEENKSNNLLKCSKLHLASGSAYSSLHKNDLLQLSMQEKNIFPSSEAMNFLPLSPGVMKSALPLVKLKSQNEENSAQNLLSDATYVVRTDKGSTFIQKMDPKTETAMNVFETHIAQVIQEPSLHEKLKIPKDATFISENNSSKSVPNGPECHEQYLITNNAGCNLLDENLSCNKEKIITPVKNSCNYEVQVSLVSMDVECSKVKTSTNSDAFECNRLNISNERIKPERSSTLLSQKDVPYSSPSELVEKGTFIIHSEYQMFCNDKEMVKFEEKQSNSHSVLSESFCGDERTSHLGERHLPVAPVSESHKTVDVSSKDFPIKCAIRTESEYGYINHQNYRSSYMSTTKTSPEKREIDSILPISKRVALEELPLAVSESECMAVVNSCKEEFDKEYDGKIDKLSHCAENDSPSHKTQTSTRILPSMQEKSDSSCAGEDNSVSPCKVVTEKSSASLSPEDNDKKFIIEDWIKQEAAKKRCPWVIHKLTENEWSFCFFYKSVKLSIILEPLEQNQPKNKERAVVDVQLESCLGDGNPEWVYMVHRVILERCPLRNLKKMCSSTLQIPDLFHFLNLEMKNMAELESQASQIDILAVEFKDKGFSFCVCNMKMLVMFEVHINLSNWENSSIHPEDVTIKNYIGKMRCEDIQKVVSVVKKDKKFLFRLIREIENLVVAMANLED